MIPDILLVLLTLSIGFWLGWTAPRNDRPRD